jgi:hypothetical protein
VLGEPALGLAPAIVDEVYERIAELAEPGMTVVLLEQLLTGTRYRARRCGPARGHDRRHRLPDAGRHRGCAVWRTVVVLVLAAYLFVKPA